MGKHDFLTPKAIANRMKSKGLQKLRWYCQLCQKQCRDENGFKCHQMSDSHLRQMEVFGQNPERVVEGYSQLFEQAFLDLLRVGHPFSRVAATVVYNEFIANKTHIHMNSTKWYTLTEFVQHLGRTGQCKVDETPKGWFIQLIQEDPAEALARQKRQRTEAHEAAEEERAARELELQMERAKALAAADEDGAGDGSAAGPTELQRDELEAPISLSLAGPGPKRPRPAASRGFGDAGGEASASAAAPDMEDAAGPGTAARAPAAAKKSKLQELMEKEQRQKQRQQERGASSRGGDGSRADARRGSVNDAAHGAWLQPKLVVKVMSPQLKEAGFYKKKGVVLKVVDKFLGHVEMLDGGGEVRVDQAQLETVIPKEGGVVMVVRGTHAGWQGRLVRIDVKGFRALVHLLDGRDAGSEDWFEYEDICKLVKN